VREREWAQSELAAQVTQLLEILPEQGPLAQELVGLELRELLLEWLRAGASAVKERGLCLLFLPEVDST